MENFLKETIQSSLSDEGYQRSLSQAIDDRIRAHLADKDRQIQLIEKLVYRSDNGGLFSFFDRKLSLLQGSNLAIRGHIIGSTLELVSTLSNSSLCRSQLHAL